MNPSTPTQVCALGNTVNSVGLNTATSVSAVAVANDQSLIPLMAVGIPSGPLSLHLHQSLLRTDSLRFSTNSLSIIAPMLARTINSSPIGGAPKDDRYGHAPTFNSRNNNSSSRPAATTTRGRPIRQRSRQRSIQVLVGKGTSAPDTRGLVKKAVFCVDNVITTCTADDLHSFVTSRLCQFMYCRAFRSNHVDGVMRKNR